METDESTAAAANPSRGRILIVEDERPIILMLRRILSKSGFEIVGEVSVDAGLRRLSSEHFDLVLLDYMLPDKTGTEMLEALGDRLKNLPVIMLTGFTDVSLAVEVMKSGVADYVIKDARLEFITALPKKVEDVLERFRLRRQNIELQGKVDHSEQSLKKALEWGESEAREKKQIVERLGRDVRDPLRSILNQITASKNGDRLDRMAAESQAVLSNLDELINGLR